MIPGAVAREFLIVSILFACHLLVAADNYKRFLSAREAHDGLLHGRGVVDLLAELEELEQLGVTPDRERALNTRTDKLETALRPIFKMASKDVDGTIDAKAARYLLHRLFVQRHAWHVNGIEINSAVQNSSKVSKALHSSGHFSLRQLAHFAATLETLIQADNLKRLQETFDVLELSRLTANSDEGARQVIEAYMVMFLMNKLNPSSSNFTSIKQSLERSYRWWNDAKLFAEEVRRAVFEMSEEGAPLSLFDACSVVVEEIGERYGRWQNKDCVDIKSQLLKLETPGTGRVPLSAFWGPRLTSTKWLFRESLAYLDQVGALEGSEAPHHSVLIPNYLYSAANCMGGSSKYYNLCCINECETLLGEIEARVGDSAASPQHLAELVSTIPSDTVTAPRDLPATLISRLEAGAAQYDGRVRLHSRLFAQFLHHAFPRECPYPHLSTKALDHKDNWLELGTAPAYVELSTVQDYCDAAALSENNTAQDSCAIRWTNEDEHFMHSTLSDQSSVGASTLETSRNGFHFGLAFAICAMYKALRLLLSWAPGSSSKDLDKGYVV